jgi:hypothetical protein
MGLPGVSTPAAAAAGAVASAPAGSLSTIGSLGRSAVVPEAAAAAAGAIGAHVLASSHEQMPAELRLSAARAERKKKTEVRLLVTQRTVWWCMFELTMCALQGSDTLCDLTRQIVCCMMR